MCCDNCWRARLGFEKRLELFFRHVVPNDFRPAFQGRHAGITTSHRRVATNENLPHMEDSHNGKHMHIAALSRHFQH